MSSTSDFLRLRWPAFADKNTWPDDIIDNVYLPEAVLLVSKCKWGKLWQTGVIHYCAHLMEVAGPPVQTIPGALGGTTAAQTQPGGTIKSWKTGSISETYFDSSSGTSSGIGGIADSNLNSTAYGQAFLEIKRRIFRGGPLAR